MSASPAGGSVPDFFRLAMLRLTGENSYQPLPAETLQGPPLDGQFPLVLGRGSQQGMAIDIRLVAFCVADALAPADLEARADGLAAFVRGVGEKGNVDARTGGTGRQVSALLIWLFAEHATEELLARAANIRRQTQGSSFGRWPVDCAAIDLSDSRVRRPGGLTGRFRGGVATDLATAWRTRSSQAAPDGAALAEAQRRRRGIATALQQRSAPATYTLLAIIVLFFLATEFSGGSTKGSVLLRFGALLGPLVVQGQWWRLVSAAFLHIGWAHLFFNSWALYIYGPLVERLYGWQRFLGIYVIAAIAGNVVSIFLVGGLSAGASGAIFGLLGVTIAMLVRYRSRVPAAVREPLLRNALIVVVANAVLGVAVPGINFYAHAGGFVGGAMCGLLLRPRPFLTGLRQWRAGAVLGVVMAVAGAIALVADVVVALGISL